MRGSEREHAFDRLVPRKDGCVHISGESSPRHDRHCHASNYYAAPAYTLEEVGDGQ
jgi:hypothetical protein